MRTHVLRLCNSSCGAPTILRLWERGEQGGYTDACSSDNYIGYLSDAPAVVNAAFTALYPDGVIAAGTPLYVVLR